MAEQLANLASANGKNWVRVGGGTGITTGISLGVNWEEALVYVYYSGYCDTRHFIHNSDFAGRYVFGYNGNNTSDKWKCTVQYQYSNNVVTMSQSSFGGTDVINDTIIRVYVKLK